VDAVVLAEVVRSGFVESRHLGAAVLAGPGGEVLAALGDPGMTVYPRSAVKPLQAAATAGAGAGIGFEPTARALALASASGSHAGEPVHLQAVRATLAAAGLDEGALRCPPALPRDKGAAVEAAPIFHNCSGKHAWFLAAQAGAFPLEPRASYLDPDGPLQRAVGAALAAWSGGSGDRPGGHVGVDGCGAPTVTMPLAALATAFARLAAGAVPGGDEVVAAVRAHPVLLGGSRALDTAVVEVTGGRVLAKVGAEAVYAAADMDAGRGLALKVLDGSPRAAGPALLAVLRGLGWLDAAELARLEPLAATAVLGGGRPVGAVRPALGGL